MTALAVPRPLGSLRLRLFVLALYVGLLGMAFRTWPSYDTSPDWMLWRSLPEAIANGHIYATHTEAPFVWSPLAAWVMALVPTFFWPWLVLHISAVFLLRDWRLIALVFLSWGFWTSTASGAPFIFVFVAGALGLRGSRVGALTYIALTLLMPRPVQLPLAIWFLWRSPSIRRPAAALFAIHTAVVLWTGYLPHWVNAVLNHGLPTGNWGPTALLGLWWLAFGVPLAVWLFMRGQVGFSGLALSPYWLPEYLMMALLDLLPSIARPPGLVPRTQETISELRSRESRHATGIDGGSP